jgi:hypothetical protein
MQVDPTTAKMMLTHLLKPWHEAVADPVTAQDKVLHKLVADYAKTTYGKEYGAENIETISDYRRAFPVRSYDGENLAEGYKSLIEQVMGGQIELLLWEQPIGWAITRGTTKGESKFIPMTPTDLELRVSAGRAVMNYILEAEKYEIFTGVNLNLNFPSVVGTVTMDGREIEYGYSSGIYTKHVSQSTPITSAPTQEEIDSLGGGKTLKDWEARFELAYTKCQTQDVTLVGGVAPTALAFGKHLKKHHGIYPKDLWQTRLMTLGSTPAINTKHQPALHAMYGRQAVIREIYGATEGMFGQQRDAKRAWVPNYDLFFFEVETIAGIKMLHELRPGEMGSLVVSTPILPRYKIGDLLLALKAPYFRCIGRDQWWMPLKYWWEELLSFNLGQL